MYINAKLIQKSLILIIVFQAMLIFIISQKRYFNFDEFQVLYASASLIKDKALYHDRIGTHFPLVNMLFAWMLKIIGFKTTALLAARFVIMLVIFLTLYLVYSITTLLKDKETGLLAVMLTMSSVVFISKGIEIRHDVFNMFFNVAGVYGLIKYLKNESNKYLILSAICLGLALSSTQKAFIWNFGIMIGLLIFLLNSEKLKKAILRILVVYSTTILVVLFIVMVILITAFNETVNSIIEITIMRTYAYIIPDTMLKVKFPVPFPYSKTEVLWPLFKNNGLLYILAVISIIKGLISKVNKSSFELVIIFWAVTGILFYLYMKRPFYQSLLPTIPSIAVLAALFLRNLMKRFGGGLAFESKPKAIFPISICISVIIALIFWPMYSTVKIAFAGNNETTKQIQNVSFCLNNLSPNDKVLCFTQQQIFFDPIFSGWQNNECGITIPSMDEKCFEKRMIEQKCKLVISDYRTTLLRKEIKQKIKNNFIYSGIGHILIPGFTLQPKSEVDRLTWTPGVYYSPTLELTVNDSKVKKHLIRLDQQINSFKNLTSRPIRLVYIFHPGSFKFDNKQINQ